MIAPTLPQSAGWHGDPKRGAAMGRTDRPSLCPQVGRKFYLQRVGLNSGGYDSGGAYWGHGPRLYWATCPDGSIDFFFRARDRTAAKLEVLRRHPGARFYR